MRGAEDHKHVGAALLEGQALEAPVELKGPAKGAAAEGPAGAAAGAACCAGSATGAGAAATAVRGTGTSANKIIRVDITNAGTGYQIAPTISFTGGGGSGALATATIKIDIDKVESFGDNNTFKQEAQDVLFSATNPFSEIDVEQ